MGRSNTHNRITLIVSIALLTLGSCESPAAAQSLPKIRPSMYTPPSGGFSNPQYAFDASPITQSGGSAGANCYYVCTSPQTRTTTTLDGGGSWNEIESFSKTQSGPGANSYNLGNPRRHGCTAFVYT